MKFAGKAFVAGFAGWLGAATAIGVTAAIIGFAVRSTAKRVVGQAETYFSDKYEAMMKAEREDMQARGNTE